jgi:type IV pilus assembly protein PilE
MRKNNMIFRKFSAGVTLTELLVVVIIIGILAVLALPMLVKTMERAKLGEAASNLNLIRTGEKIYFLERGYFSGGATGLDVLNIEDPNDASESRYFNYTITSDAGDGDNFTARAQRRDSAPSPYDTYYYEINKSGTITSNGPLQP